MIFVADFRGTQMIIEELRSLEIVARQMYAEGEKTKFFIEGGLVGNMTALYKYRSIGMFAGGLVFIADFQRERGETKVIVLVDIDRREGVITAMIDLTPSEEERRRMLFNELAEQIDREVHG